MLIKRRSYWIYAFVAVVAVATMWVMSASQNQQDFSNNGDAEQCLEQSGGQVWIEGGSFMMGDDDAYPEEGPAHLVRLDGYWIDTHEVTNGQFARFIDETGYLTVAERVPDPADFPGAPPEMLRPGSVTFTPPGEGARITQWWSYTPGANWRHPDGPDSSIAKKAHYPVVHIAFEDAQAYVSWAGRALPTEAQYEFAARSNRDNERYAWGGDEFVPEGEHQANTWQGLFPLQNTQTDGYKGIAPVGCFPPNAYQAYDLIGNVWEWTGNWYAPNHNPADSENPQGPSPEQSYDWNNAGYPVRVIKGGSYLCAPSYCKRYRPAARIAQDTGLGTSHIGFRTVSNSSVND